MVNLVITLRHALKYRGGRVVQRGETRGASWTVRNRVVKMSKGGGEDRNGKGRKGVEKKCDRFRWQNYKKPRQSWPINRAQGGKIGAKIEKQYSEPRSERIKLEGRRRRF